MRLRQRKVDGNQRAIVAALRAAGCSALLLHRVGDGCPDLLVVARGETFLVELKMPGEKLNSVQREWHREWRGRIEVWTSVEDVIAWLQR